MLTIKRTFFVKIFFVSIVAHRGENSSHRSEGLWCGRHRTVSKGSVKDWSLHSAGKISDNATLCINWQNDTSIIVITLYAVEKAGRVADYFPCWDSPLFPMLRQVTRITPQFVISSCSHVRFSYSCQHEGCVCVFFFSSFSSLYSYFVYFMLDNVLYSLQSLIRYYTYKFIYIFLTT